MTELVKEGRSVKKRPRQKTERDKQVEKAWKIAHKEELKQSRRRYYLAHKESENRRSRQYKRDNYASCKIKNKAWRRANPDKWLASQKVRTARWEARNPGARAARTERRRALLRCAKVSNEKEIAEFMDRVKSRRWIRCYYCSSKIPGKKAVFDHVKALSRNGEHSIENICATCEKCNLKKHAKSLTEWVRPGQQVLPI